MRLAPVADAPFPQEPPLLHLGPGRSRDLPALLDRAPRRHPTPRRGAPPAASGAPYLAWDGYIRLGCVRIRSQGPRDSSPDRSAEAARRRWPVSLRSESTLPRRAVSHRGVGSSLRLGGGTQVRFDGGDRLSLYRHSDRGAIVAPSVR